MNADLIVLVLKEDLGDYWIKRSVTEMKNDGGQSRQDRGGRWYHMATNRDGNLFLFVQEGYI